MPLPIKNQVIIHICIGMTGLMQGNRHWCIWKRFAHSSCLLNHAYWGVTLWACGPSVRRFTTSNESIAQRARNRARRKVNWTNLSQRFADDCWKRGFGLCSPSGYVCWYSRTRMRLSYQDSLTQAFLFCSRLHYFNFIMSWHELAKHLP